VAGFHGAVNMSITQETYAPKIRRQTENSLIIPQELYRLFLLQVAPLIQLRRPPRKKQISTGVSVCLPNAMVTLADYDLDTDRSCDHYSNPKDTFPANGTPA